MGDFAKTPIEPAEVTRVLDLSEGTVGILIAGAPGAGGYDAVFALAFDDSVIQTLENVWLSHAEMFV
jgi:phosphomevalonate kinase